MRRWKWCVPAVAGVALALSGCGSSSPTSTPKTTSPSSPTSTTPTTAAAPTTTTTSPSSATSTTVDCLTSQLSASLGQGSGAAGTIYYQLELHNTSSSTCDEFGYPGVSFVTGPGGSQIGAAANRMPGTERKVVLVPGATAYATLGVADAGNFPASCQMTKAPDLRVYPPNQTASLLVAISTEGCANSADQVLHIEPFTASPPAS